MSAIRVVTLRAPGFVWRAASEPVTITGDTSGAPLFADARLYDVSGVINEVNLYDLQRSEFTSCDVTMGVPATLSAADLDAAFGHLAFALAEVAVYDPTLPWKRRQVLIGRGIVSGLKIDVAGMALVFTVEASNPVTSESVGDGSRDMGLDYPSLGFPSLSGKQWPTGVGRLYGIPGHKLGLLGGGTSALGLFGHHVADLSQSFSVYEDGAAYTAAGTLSLVNTYDSNGEPISYVMSNDTADFTAAQGSFTVDLDSSAGLSNGSSAIGAPAVIRWLLTEAGVAVDWARMQPAFAALQGLDIGIYSDSETSALRLLRDRIVAALPLIEETGPNGIWLRVAVPSMLPVTGHLVEGANLVGFTGAMEQTTDPDSIRNRLISNYGYDHYTGAYLKRAVVDWTNHPMCAPSYSLAGALVDDEEDLDITWHDATAAELTRARAERVSMHRYTISAAVVAAGAAGLDAGQCWTVTAPSRGWVARRCTVVAADDADDIREIKLEPQPLPVIRGPR